jgi:hypothetical protein
MIGYFIENFGLKAPKFIFLAEVATIKFKIVNKSIRGSADLIKIDLFCCIITSSSTCNKKFIITQETC